MPIQERGFAQGLIWMSSRLGGAVVPFLIVWLTQLEGNWASPLIIISFLGVLWCIAFWPWFRNHPAEVKSVNEAERALIAAGRGSASAGSARVPWSRIFRSRSVWALCLMY